jgi:uncharacterized membrane protein YgaE (UPF0421/DUF939 family)
MKKKSIFMLLGTLVIGIIIGAVFMSIFTHHKWKTFSEPPTKEKFIQRTIRMIDPDETQLSKISPIIDKYSEKAYLYTKENMELMSANFESLYSELKPFLNDKQKQKFEKKINNIKSGIGK